VTCRHARIVETQACDSAAAGRSPRQPRGCNRGAQVEAFQSAIFAAAFDNTGSRLITCEADKSIKMWREDPDATPETHPVVFKPPRDLRRY
jgi:hypothetical protein